MDWLLMSGLGGGLTIVIAAMLVCMFWAALVHPNRIRNMSVFRAAVWILGAGLVIPIVGMALTAVPDSSSPSSMSRGGAPFQYLMLVQYLAIGISLCLSLDSVMWRND